MNEKFVIGRKHDAKAWEFIHGPESNIVETQKSFNALLSTGRSHPVFACIRIYEGHPTRQIHFKTEDVLKAEAKQTEKDNLAQKAQAEAEVKKAQKADPSKIKPTKSQNQ